MPDNLNLECASQARSMDRDTLLAYYWRKGIPSIVLAVVTALLAGYSYWFVQPNIQQRYRDLCSRTFQLRGDDSVDLQVASGDREVEWDSQPASRLRGSEERRRLLEQTHLCLRRLIIWDNSDDALRFQTGRVSDLLADWYLNRARAIPLEKLNGDELATLLGHSRSERQKATEVMRSVQKRNGRFSNKASLWLAHRQLVDNHELPTADLDAVAERVVKISNNTYATHLLRQVWVLQALSCRNDMPVGERLMLLQAVNSLFESSATHSIASLGWAAEAKALLDAAAAKELGNKTLQMFWASRDRASLSVESLAAVFRCFLVINSVREGQLFLSEQLKEVSSIDEPRLRALTAAAALRHVVSIALQRKDDGVAGTADGLAAAMPMLILSMAVQLNPESLELLALLEKFTKAENQEPTVVWLKRELSSVAEVESNRGMPAAVDLAMKSLLNAVIGLGTGFVDKSAEDALAAAVKASPAYGVAASRLVMRLVSSESMSIADAIRYLRTMNTAAPDVLVAWSDRASLHMENSQIADAIECYEYLIEKLPGNEQIGEALDLAKRLAKTADEH